MEAVMSNKSKPTIYECLARMAQDAKTQAAMLEAIGMVDSAQINRDNAAALRCIIDSMTTEMAARSV